MWLIDNSLKAVCGFVPFVYLPFSWCLAQSLAYGECLVNVPVEFNWTIFALGKPHFNFYTSTSGNGAKVGQLERISWAFWCRPLSYSSGKNGKPAGIGWWFTDVSYLVVNVKRMNSYLKIERLYIKIQISNFAWKIGRRGITEPSRLHTWEKVAAASLYGIFTSLTARL